MSAYSRRSTSGQRVNPARSNCRVHHSNEAMVRWPSTSWPSASTARSASGTGPRNSGPRLPVVVHPLGTDLALEVPVGAGRVGPERRDGGIEVAAAHPVELGQGDGHPVGRQVLEDLERGHQLEGPVRPREAGEQVGHPDVARRPRGWRDRRRTGSHRSPRRRCPARGAPRPGSRWHSRRRASSPPGSSSTAASRRCRHWRRSGRSGRTRTARHGPPRRRGPRRSSCPRRCRRCPPPGPRATARPRSAASVSSRPETAISRRPRA